MYACGPTVYRFAHVGNMRTFLLPDLIRRNSERHGWSAIVCQNITDVGHLADDNEPDPDGEDRDKSEPLGRLIEEMSAAHKSPTLRIIRRYKVKIITIADRVWVR